MTRLIVSLAIVWLVVSTAFLLAICCAAGRKRPTSTSLDHSDYGKKSTIRDALHHRAGKTNRESPTVAASELWVANLPSAMSGPQVEETRDHPKQRNERQGEPWNMPPFPS